MKSISTIFKVSIIIMLIALALWCYNSDNQIIANFGTYKIYTSFFSIILLFLFLLMLYYFCLVPFIKLGKKMTGKTRSNQIMKIMSLFDLHDEKAIILMLVNNLEHKNELKVIINTKLLIQQANYHKAIAYIKNHMLKDQLLVIQQYYLCIAYSAIKETSSLIMTLEHAISSGKNYNFWFLKILITLNQEQPVLNQLLFLYNKFDLIKFPSKQKKKKYFCILLHLLAENLIKENNPKEAQVYISKIIDTYPDYTPIYEHHLSLNKNEFPQKKINSILEKAWIHQPSYCSIKLWLKYFDIENIDLEKQLKHLQNESNKNQYCLLLASLYLKQEHLIKASEYLEQSHIDNMDKLLIEISLFAKERDYKKLMHSINNLLKHSDEKYWWN